MAKEIEHWNNFWEGFEPWDVDKASFMPEDYFFFNIIGDLKGKKVLDVGCGNGECSMFYARRGAIVTAIDNSETGIKNTLRNAEFHKVDIEAIQIDALKLSELNKTFDIIAGKFILHHLEPFNEFVEILYNLLETGGKCIFFENNARNKILIFLRQTIVGKFGIPKYGDNMEFPFEYKEIKMIESKFSEVRLSYPSFRFFSLLAPYIFKNNKKVDNITHFLDKFIYDYLPLFRKYSYWQIVEFYK